MQVSDIQQLITGFLSKIQKSESLDLIPGRVITALLKEVKGDIGLLSYRGNDFVARLEIPVPAGQHLKFRVEGHKDGQTVLKLISNDMVPGSRSLTGVTTNLGLQDDPVNRSLVSEMIKQGMSLNAETASKLSAFVRTVGIPVENLWASVLMQNTGITLTEHNYKHIITLTDNPGYFQEDLKQLSTLLSGLNADDNLPEGMKFPVSELDALLRVFELNPQAGSQTIAKQLAKIFRVLTGSSLLAGQEPIPPLHDLLADFSSKFKETGLQEFRDAVQLIEKFSDKVEFLRNLNSKSAEGQENTMILYSGVQFEGSQEPLRLLIKHRKEKDNRDFNSCKIEVKLNTPGLGLVKCQVQVTGKSLLVQFTGLNETVAKFLDRFTPVLGERMRELNYNISFLDAKVAGEADEDSIAGNRNDVPGLFQLNLKV